MVRVGRPITARLVVRFPLAPLKKIGGLTAGVGGSHHSDSSACATFTAPQTADGGIIDPCKAEKGSTMTFLHLLPESFTNQQFFNEHLMFLALCVTHI